VTRIVGGVRSAGRATPDRTGRGRSARSMLRLAARRLVARGCVSSPAINALSTTVSMLSSDHSPSSSTSSSHRGEAPRGPHHSFSTASWDAPPALQTGLRRMGTRDSASSSPSTSSRLASTDTAALRVGESGEAALLAGDHVNKEYWDYKRWHRRQMALKYCRSYESVADQGSLQPLVQRVHRFDDGADLGEVTMRGDVWNVPVRLDILQRVVRWQLAKRRAGNHQTKTYATIRYTGRKPHPQKGTGRARQGSKHAPHHKGGVPAHGPVTRSHEHSIPRKVRRLGMKCALSARAAEGQVYVVDSLALDSSKTRDFAAMLEVVRQRLGNFKRILLVDCNLPPPVDADAATEEGAEPEDSSAVAAATESTAVSWEYEYSDDKLRELEEEGRLAFVGVNLGRAAANVPAVDLLPPQGVNVYTILQNDAILLSVDAVRMLEGRLTRAVKR